MIFLPDFLLENKMTEAAQCAKVTYFLAWYGIDSELVLLGLLLNWKIYIRGVETSIVIIMITIIRMKMIFIANI